MASASTNKTIWTVALVGVIAFLTWKLWPAIKKALNSAGGGAGGAGGAVGAGGVGGAPYYPSSSSPGSSLGFPNPSFGGGGGAGLSLQNWLGDIFQGLTNAQGLSTQLGYNPVTGTDELAALDTAGLPTVPYQNFDVNQLAYGPDNAMSYDSSYGDSLDTISMDYNPGIDGGEYDYGSTSGDPTLYGFAGDGYVDPNSQDGIYS